MRKLIVGLTLLAFVGSDLLVAASPAVGQTLVQAQPAPSPVPNGSPVPGTGGLYQLPQQPGTSQMPQQPAPPQFPQQPGTSQMPQQPGAPQLPQQPGAPRLPQEPGGTQQPVQVQPSEAAPKEVFSRIESTFNVDPVGVSAQGVPFGTPLRQYGYATFTSKVSTFAPVDDVPVGPDYVLGPGDNLTIDIWGGVDSTMVRTVDRSGRIVLPKVGDLRLWGLTFAQADRLIRDQLARYFRGFNTAVTMGRLRTVRVHVAGEVNQPGVYTLSSLARVTNALYAAGGPAKLGSLRDIHLLRNGHMVGRLDLYDFLQRGDRLRDYRLESDDTIFVPTIGDVVAMAGEVKRPAIYEIKGTARLSDLVEMAGGVTPTSYLKRVQVVRSLPSAERVTMDVDMTEFYLKGKTEGNPVVNSGDLVLIHRSDPRVYNTVKVEGAVKYPGLYELKPMMRISQLLPAEKLLPAAQAERVEVARRKPDLSIEIVPLDLKKAWEGDAEQDLLLRPLDEITVRTELRAAQSITLAGQVVRPGAYTITEGERLSSVIERAGGFTDRAHLKSAVFTRASLRRVEQEQLDAFIKAQEQRILATASTVTVGAEKEEVASQQQALQARREALRALASKVALGRMVVHLDQPDKLKGTENDVVLAEGDSLAVSEPPQSVFVIGAVRTSTSVQYKDGANVDYYINRVGGFAREADKKEVHIVKADGSAVSSFTNIRAVEPGDSIIVPPKEEEKIRALPTIRDVVQTVGGALLSVAALLVLF